MKQIITILLFIFCFSAIVVGQTRTEQTELKELKIIDTNLINALDSFLKFEQSRDYYNDSLYINIDICNYDWKVGENCHLSDSMSIAFFAITYKPFLFNKENIGFIIYNNHLCTVSGQYLDKLFLRLTESKIFYFEISNSNVSYMPRDDKYSIWNYLYTYDFLFFLQGEK